ncbi:MAG: response regulator transcription factor [Oligoflexia bacterium]|nr:response regulator transcription factor [Oligoflexia bacterium]
MKSERTIWILEDETGARFVFEEVLGLRYQLQFFSSLRGFLQALNEQELRPDLVIADLRLAEENFLDFISEEKNVSLIRAPFIIVSSVDDLDILRACFEDGALDYLTKPFTKNELVVKVERILKVRPPHTSQGSDWGVILDASKLTVKRDNSVSVQLTAKELRIFSLLHSARGESVSRKQLLSEVWSGVTVTAKTLDVHLFHLRKKLAKLDIEIRFVAPDGYALLTAPKTPPEQVLATVEEDGSR